MAKETLLSQVQNLGYEAQNLLIKEVFENGDGSDKLGEDFSDTAAHLGISYDDQLTLIAAFHSVQGGGSGTETISVLRNSLYAFEEVDRDLSDLSVIFPAPSGITAAAKDIYDAIIADYPPYDHNGVMPSEARALMTQNRISDADGRKMVDTYWTQAFAPTNITVSNGEPNTSTPTELYTKSGQSWLSVIGVQPVKPNELNGTARNALDGLISRNPPQSTNGAIPDHEMQTLLESGIEPREFLCILDTYKAISFIATSGASYDYVMRGDAASVAELTSRRDMTADAAVDLDLNKDGMVMLWEATAYAYGNASGRPVSADLEGATGTPPSPVLEEGFHQGLEVRHERNIARDAVFTDPRRWVLGADIRYHRYISDSSDFHPVSDGAERPSFEGLTRNQFEVTPTWGLHSDTGADPLGNMAYGAFTVSTGMHIGEANIIPDLDPNDIDGSDNQTKYIIWGVRAGTQGEVGFRPFVWDYIPIYASLGGALQVGLDETFAKEDPYNLKTPYVEGEFYNQYSVRIPTSGAKKNTGTYIEPYVRFSLAKFHVDDQYLEATSIFQPVKPGDPGAMLQNWSTGIRVYVK